jgi:hypothetical protein
VFHVLKVTISFSHIVIVENMRNGEIVLWALIATIAYSPARKQLQRLLQQPVMYPARVQSGQYDSFSESVTDKLFEVDMLLL